MKNAVSFTGRDIMFRAIRIESYTTDETQWSVRRVCKYIYILFIVTLKYARFVFDN